MAPVVLEPVTSRAKPSRLSLAPVPMPRRRTPRAFTLAEMLVVMAVVGVLAAVGVPRYHGAQQRAYLAVMQSDLRAVRVAQESYVAENGSYALTVAALALRPSDGVALSLGSSDPRRGWRAVAVHAYADITCEVGVGVDAPAGRDGEILCPARAGRGGTPAD